MPYLLLASLIWALSFGLIKTSLQALDPSFVGWARLLLSLAIFGPLIAPLRQPRLALRLAAIGAIQYGLMYSLYLAAYSRLESYQVALFTVLTPIYVVAWDDLRSRRFHPRGLALAALAVVGAALLHPRGADPREVAIGFALVQAANACFAIGQIEYRRLRRARPELRDHRIHGYLLLGGVGLTTLTTTLRGGWASAAALDLQAAAALAYLGLIASGIGFFAWNAGAVRVESATLAVLNNLKVPLGVALSLLLFGEEADLLRLALGGGVMIAAAAAAERGAQRPRVETP